MISENGAREGAKGKSPLLAIPFSAPSRVLLAFGRTRPPAFVPHVSASLVYDEQEVRASRGWLGARKLDGIVQARLGRRVSEGATLATERYSIDHAGWLVS